MKKLKFRSLTMRIWTTFTVIILIIICSISLLYLVAFKKFNETGKMQDLKVAHDILLNNNTYDQPNRFDEMRNLKGIDHFIVKTTDTNSTQLIDINKRQGPPPQGDQGGRHFQTPNDTELRMWMAGYAKDKNIKNQEHKETYNGTKFMFIVSSIESDKTGKTYLISYVPNLQDNSVLYMILIVGVVFIGIGFITAKVVANRISKPLKDLEDYTVKIARKDWKEPIDVNSGDEIGRLAVAMNQMQRELKRADEEEKTFLQSISHDLKTPVMVIMSHAEAIVDGVYVDSVEKTAEIIRDEAVSLEKKIKQMLYLNTLDYVLDNNSESEEIDLQSLMLNIVNRFELVNSKIEWDLDMDKAVIKGNSEKVKVAIENIIDNGLRYAKDEIRIALKEENNKALLEIYNDGPNIDEKHIGHIFDNLYKDKTGNFGLGLAITKKIINFYKGDVKVINRDKGVSFIIGFPI